MKTISSISEVLNLQSDLSKFILESCPWMSEEWEPESIGYVFILDDSDINTTPHIEIDLATFDLWETPAIYNPKIGYWNVVAILGQEYGCTLFMSSGFVSFIPELDRRLNDIKQ